MTHDEAVLSNAFFRYGPAHFVRKLGRKREVCGEGQGARLGNVPVLFSTKRAAVAHVELAVSVIIGEARRRDRGEP